MSKFFFLLVCFFVFSFYQSAFADNRFLSGIITSPRGGYIDSVFITPDEKRIYFLHSVMAPLDFAQGTSDFPRANYLPGHVISPGYEWNADLYYIEWNGQSWSMPVNLGPNINTRVNECCIWLNNTETIVIFARDEDGTSPRGNYIATRPSVNSPWGETTLLPASYGGVDQSPLLYRHDIQRMVGGTDDLYLWEKNNANPDNPGRLLYGKKNGSLWLEPTVITSTDSSDEETQPWVSADEKTILYTRRNASAVTTLWRVVRSSLVANWGTPVQVPTTGFNDPNGLAVWGEVSIPSGIDKMIAVRLNTAVSGWQAEIVEAEGSPTTGYQNFVVLNAGVPPIVPRVEGDLNQDGIVNSLDWSIMNSEWFEYTKPSDINGDGITNSLDRALMLRNWLLIP